MKKVLPYILAFLMISGGIAHMIMPDFYAPMIPAFIPVGLANLLAAIVELIVGVLLVLPKYRSQGGLLFMGLMIIYLPLHAWDLFRENPAIGPMPIPVIRFIFQFVLIYAGWITLSRGKK